MYKYQFSNIPHEREDVVIEKVKLEMSLGNVSVTGISRACGRSRATIYRWLRGETGLLWENVCDILDYLDENRR